MEEGFTLLEVLVVLAILSVFAGIVGTVIGTSILSTEIEASEEGMEALKEALLSYYADVDGFPTATGDAEIDLADLVTDPGVGGWDGPYISAGFENNDFVKDAWKRTLAYSHSPGASSCTLTSNGPDGIYGNSDDLVMTIDATAVYKRKVDRIRMELEIVKAAAQADAANNGHRRPVRRLLPFGRVLSPRRVAQRVPGGSQPVHQLRAGHGPGWRR